MKDSSRHRSVFITQQSRQDQTKLNIGRNSRNSGFIPLSVRIGHLTLMMADQYLESRKEVKGMNYLCRASAYLNSMASTVNSLCGMILSDEMQGNVKVQYKIAVELLDLEQVTVDFIDHMGLANEMTHAVLKSKRRFMSINKRLVKHLEKIQLQGYHFDELITTLKLENKTLEKEIHFL